MKRAPSMRAGTSAWVAHWAAGEVAAGALALPRRAARVLSAARGWAGAVSLLAALALVLTLVACGPGLGGTGTGATEEALAAYGAREVAVCNAEFADLLGCPAPGTAAAPQPASGARHFAEAGAAAGFSRTLLTLSGNEAELQLRCLDRLFVGSFGQVGTDTPRYFGVVYSGGTRVALATLLVQRVGTGAGTALSLSLVDAAGSTLFGPQLVQPVGGTTLPARCS